MAEKKLYDVVIIGGGIAGMTAAIYAARANLTTAIVEQNICGGLVNSTYVVENFPSYSSINGMELMEKVLDQVEFYLYLNQHVNTHSAPTMSYRFAPLSQLFFVLDEQSI